MQAHHFCHAATICAGNGHEFDRDYGFGKCKACGRSVITAALYERLRRHGYAGRNPDGSHWALKPARLGGGLATRVELEV